MSMPEDRDQDDVDVFVSPRRFGGRTPGPKATRKKVFEENRAKAESNIIENDDVSMDSVKYNIEPGRDAEESVHKKIGRNNVLRRVLLIANYVMVLLGLALLGVSIWVLLRNKNGGIFSFMSRKGILIRSPIAIGLCLLVAAGGCIIAGYFVGVRHVAPSVVEGLQLSQRRKIFLWYQVICVLTCVVLGVVFFCSLPTLSTTKNIGITSSSWRDLSIAHPDRICMFEIANNCAGAKDHSCAMKKRASVNKGCPGHYCTETCKATSASPATVKHSCSACLTAFTTAGELDNCRNSEGRNSSSRTCIPTLRGQVRDFLTVVVASSGVGIAVLLLVTILGTISPILHARS